MRDLTPEEYEDLVDSDRHCHAGCIDGNHHDRLTPTVHAPVGAGWRGSIGSHEQVSRDLWRLAGEHLGHGDSPTTGKAVMEHAALYRRLLTEWEEEQQARLVVWEAQQATQRARARFERRAAAAVRRRTPRQDRRSPNRPTRVDVHPEAWTLVKQHAIKNSRPIADVVGVLVVEAALPEHQPTVDRARAKRFARLFVDDADWLDLRAHAEHLGITVALLIGLIVEAEAVRLGWLPEEQR